MVLSSERWGSHMETKGHQNTFSKMTKSLGQ